MVKFLGNTDEVTTCDCCGRKELKGTVALSIDESEPVYYGVVCAARALKTDAKTVRKESNAADAVKAESERKARYAEHSAFMAKWEAFLASHGSGKETFEQIQSLGGYTAARKLYTEVQS